MPITVGNHDFDYGKVKFGNNRGIRIWVDGQKSSSRTYKLRPDPSVEGVEDNAKDEPRFYRELAVAIAEQYNLNNRWPDAGTTVYVRYARADFTLEDR